MLSKLWIPSVWTFNPQQSPAVLSNPDTLTKKYKNLKYYTLPFESSFENIDKAVMFREITTQQDAARKEIALYEKYEYFNKAISQKMIEQYNTFFLWEWFYYNTHELREWLFKKLIKRILLLEQRSQKIQTTHLQQSQQYKIQPLLFLEKLLEK